VKNDLDSLPIGLNYEGSKQNININRLAFYTWLGLYRNRCNNALKGPNSELVLFGFRVKANESKGYLDIHD
jgi:hypothetical protein